MKLMKILVAVDGSAYTRKALDYLIANRGMLVDGHQLVILHVATGLPPHISSHIGKQMLDEHYADEAAKVLGPVEAWLQEHGVRDVVIDRRHGHAAEEIVKAAGEHGVGLIVVGSHGHGLFGRALMGSVTAKVIAEAKLSVLLVQ